MKTCPNCGSMPVIWRKICNESNETRVYCQCPKCGLTALSSSDAIHAKLYWDKRTGLCFEIVHLIPFKDKKE